MRPAILIVARRLLVATLVAAMVAIGALWWFQRDLIYPGSGKYAHVWDLDPRGYETVILQTDDGLELRALYRAATSDRPTLLFFHGNGGTVRAGIETLEPVVAEGYGALLVEYRGYAGNPGTPSEDGLMHDARAGVRFLAARDIMPGNIVVGGYSLGSGVAARIADEIEPRALFLMAPYTSLAAAAAETVGIDALRLLVRDRFDTQDVLRGATVPLFIAHGTADEVIPVDHGRALADMRPDARALFLDGVGHEVAWNESASDALLDWLEEVR